MAEIITVDGPLKDIASPAKDNVQMSKYWVKSSAIVEGIDEMRNHKEFLPQFEAEDDSDYKVRVNISTMTNIYGDVLESLAEKPFSKMVELNPESVSTDLFDLIDNIDGRGNHLHDFLGDTFYKGINNAIDWILIDHPVNENLNLTIERQNELNLKPYWSHVNSSNVLDIRSDMSTGIEELSYIRMLEINDGEKSVRVIDARNENVQFRIYKENDKGEWFLYEEGVITLDEIPMVPFITGRRKGKSWQFKPALKNAADAQIELYQEETRKKSLKDNTGYGVFTADGINPPKEINGKTQKLRIGAKSILYAPPNGDGTYGQWGRLDADAQLFKVFSDDIKELQNQIREIGKQPLTAQSGGVTRINSSMAASKSNSAVQMWVNSLEQATIKALMITAKWLGETDIKKPDILIHKDFLIEMDSNPVPDVLANMRNSGDLSQQTYWQEMKRNKVLSPNFDAEKEKEFLMDEITSGEPEFKDELLT